MKKIIIVLTMAISITSNSQTGLNATLNSFKRPTPLIGFNGQANFCTGNWANQSWLDSLATLNTALLRFPGGTNANHWDWQTGWYQNAATTPSWVANLTGTCISRADEFKIGMNACNSKALLVINFQHSNIGYQIQGLNYAISKGVPVEKIEMGNEHNIGSSAQQYIPAGTYASLGKVWADSLKSHYPNSKICMVGGAIGTTTAAWHDSIFSKNPNIDALSFHLYLTAGNNDNNYFTRRALSMPFGNTTGVNYRYNTAKFTQTVIPSNIEIWATEYNLGEAVSGCPIQHAGTWTHALYLNCMSNELMNIPKITMLLNHDVAGSNDFAAVDNNNKITAAGVSMGLLGSVSKGTDSTQLITFNSQPTITWSTTTYPSLMGWKFWKTNSNTKNAWITNLSSQTIKVSVDQIIGTNFSFAHYKADTNFVVNGIKSLSITTGFSTDSITIPPYSITVLKDLTNTSINESSKEYDFTFYPNPVSQTLYFSKSLEAVKIYDVYGRNIKSCNGSSRNISVDDLPDGVYFLQTQHYSKRFIVKH